MLIEQLYTNCLAEAAYYIESNGEAAIIDPLRETTPYLEMAESRNTKIKYVFETHFHADFVSGHIDLAKETGAQIVYGPTANPEYDVIVAEDNQEFQVGDIKIRVLHTPGHTMESSSYLVIDEDGIEHAVFTGDTLFIGDVGRPDLAVKSDLTQEDLAGLLYESLNTKIKTLPDYVIVYPAHGAGSSCGKNLGQEKFSTIGLQKRSNYALQDMPKEKFIDVVTDGLATPPKYFFKDAMINKTGYKPYHMVMNENTVAIDLKHFEKYVEDGAIIIDSRHQDLFEKGFIPGSYNFPLDGQFAVWLGELIDFENRFVIIAENHERAEETVMRMARIGFEDVKGYLEGGIETWIAAGHDVNTMPSIPANELAEYISNGYQVVDVRRPTEAQTEHVKDAINIELTVIEASQDQFDPSQKYALHCAGGYRSMIACSILRKHGISNFVNIRGGWKEMKLTDNLEYIAGKCPNTLRQEKLNA